MMFKVIEERPQKDGSMILVCDYDKAFVEAYKKATGRVRATKRGMEKWILAAIERGCKLDKETNYGNV
jgi:hypothetical protein